eukprot:3941380-Rhodomonas_salina.1
MDLCFGGVQVGSWSPVQGSDMEAAERCRGRTSEGVRGLASAGVVSAYHLDDLSGWKGCGRGTRQDGAETAGDLEGSVIGGWGRRGDSEVDMWCERRPGQQAEQEGSGCHDPGEG